MHVFRCESAYRMIVFLVLLVGVAQATRAQEAGPDSAAGHWANFNHYVRIARPDLAAVAARALLADMDNDELLQVVESGDYPNWHRTLEEAKKNKSLSKSANELGQRIQDARIAKSRDKDRISQDIELLAKTLRQRLNAIERLRAAGQFSAPQMLSILQDVQKAQLHAHVEIAMIAIGRPLVYPLSVAFSQLEPVQMNQVARVLADIGYRRAIPYLKEVLEDPNTDPDARIAVQIAFDRLVDEADMTADISAAHLFLTLAENYYDAGTIGKQLPGYDSAMDRGIVWTYTPQVGLLAISVLSEVYPDVLAMRAARRALQLDAQLDPALSLWLAANLRRENRLVKGKQDRITEQGEPAFYLRMAGPLRQHDVLHRALNDNDAELALDAIFALQATSGTDALINRQGTVQPLLRALSFPDRRVRFPAAFVMAQARPTDEFPGSHRVVSVLAEAVRQSALRHALVIASNPESRNQLMADLKDLDYAVAGGLSLSEVTDVINFGSGFDLLVVNGSAKRIKWIYGQTEENYKLAAVPVLAVVSAFDRNKLNLTVGRDRRFHTVLDSSDAKVLRAAAKQAAQSASGQPITAKEAAKYASNALRVLRQISWTVSSVYDASNAEPALIDALQDDREDIVIGAAQVLEMINSQAAQLALAEAALDGARDVQVSISLLNSLAESANQFGNRLGQIQLDNLTALARLTKGEYAKAAARAHGSLALPTSSLVDLIVE